MVFYFFAPKQRSGSQICSIQTLTKKNIPTVSPLLTVQQCSRHVPGVRSRLVYLLWLPKRPPPHKDNGVRSGQRNQLTNFFLKDHQSILERS